MEQKQIRLLQANIFVWVALGELNAKSSLNLIRRISLRSLLARKSTHAFQRPTRFLVEIAMLCSLPPDIFDLITDHLCNDGTALHACCLASKSWIPLARRHLFAGVSFSAAGPSLRLWMEAFPDPSNSPAHHVRRLFISQDVPPNSPWIRSFDHVEYLDVNTLYWEGDIEASLFQFHGLSPTLKSLSLSHLYIPLWETFHFVCSFPLLEDLALRCDGPERDEWFTLPSTSPKFIGTLRLIDEIRSSVHGLLNLPGGLHFTKIAVSCPVIGVQSAMDLVSRCSDTLEFLCISYYFASTFPSTPEFHQYLTSGL